MNCREISLGDVIHVKHGFAFKSLHFSNNGEYILFAASPHHDWSSDYEIFIKSFSGGKAVRLTFHPGSDIWPDLFIPVERRNAVH